jgi:transcriptional regulator with PAS, ATPase and Fis domain
MRMLGLDFQIPPLRERPEDMAALVALFLSKKNILLDGSVYNELVDHLKSYRWAGNIRQLFKSLDAWLLNCELDGLPLTAENFPIFKDLKGTQPAAAAQPPGSEDFNSAARQDRHFEELIAAYERAIIDNAMKRHDSVASVCKAINLPRSTLDGKRKKFGLS